MYTWKRILAIIVVLSTLLPQLTFADDGFQLISPRTTAPRVCDPLTCQLPTEITITERFLRDRKNGLPYTPDPRPLSSELEVLRLNQLSQTMGYLNLSKQYPANAIYKQEALNRVEYFLNLGSAALGNGPRDGMIAYMFFNAYQRFGDQRYLNAGIAIANYCLTIPEKDKAMNGGLMCAIGLGAAYQATGNTTYRDVARQITMNTAPKQFTDGAFPHLPTLAGGKNLSYTSWMVTELLILGQFDAQDPNTDFLALKAADFLSQRITSTGTLTYATATENYDSDPGNINAGVGHGVGDLFAVAQAMNATGRSDLASRVLRFAFTQRMGGTNYGGYPDVYGAEEPITNLWLSGKPSVLRTSLIFWYMTMFKSFTPSCSAGVQILCSSTATTSAYAIPEHGSKYCLANRYTSCLDLLNSSWTPGQICGEETTCTDTGSAACYQTCTLNGSQFCQNGICAGMCYDVNDQGQPAPTCIETCYENRSCGDMPASITQRVSTDDLLCRIQ